MKQASVTVVERVIRLIRIAMMAVIVIGAAAYSPIFAGYVGPGTPASAAFSALASWAVVNVASVWTATLRVVSPAGPALGASLPASELGSPPPVILAQAKPATPTPASTAPSAGTPAKPAPGGSGSAGPSQTGSVPPSGTATLSQGDLALVVTLLRTTLVALHQANQTGNYTVLRDLGAPGFRDANTATKLGEIFAPLRSSRVDLSAVVLLDPHLATAKVGDNGMLDIAGSLTMQPVPVNFELLYQGVQNSWQLFGISVSTDPAPTAAATPAAGAKPTGAPATSSGPAAPASAAASSAKSAASTPRQ